MGDVWIHTLLKPVSILMRLLEVDHITDCLLLLQPIQLNSVN